jgi:hypothetical protein
MAVVNYTKPLDSPDWMISPVLMSQARRQATRQADRLGSRRSAWLRALALVPMMAFGAVVAAGSTAHASGSGTPYTDTSAVGYIGLCNKAGQQITSGSINTKPFAWRAVSSQPAQAPYSGAGRTALLLAYQPREGLPAGEWSGDALTASSRYSNAAHPMVAATSGDDSIKDFIGEFAPAWDGLLQIRMYLGAPDSPIYSLTYPAIDIKVTGNTWQAVDGGPVSCTSGRSESIETILLPKATPKAHASAHPTSKSTTGPVASSAPTAVSSVRAGAAAGTPKSLAAKPVADSSDSSHTPIIVAVLIAVVLVLLFTGYVLSRRRRRPLPVSPPASPIHSTSEKGR